jgi:hypothetical protein
VRVAEPDGPDPSLDNSMRLWRHLGQPGRSMAEMCAGGTGSNSGITYRDWVTAKRPIGLMVEPNNNLLSSPALVKVAHFENLLSEK